MDGVLNYPAYYPLGRAFQATNGSIAELAAMHDTLKAGVKDTTLLGNFLENHVRVLSCRCSRPPHRPDPFFVPLRPSRTKFATRATSRTKS